MSVTEKSGLNDDQKARLAVTLRSVHKLLSDADRILSTASRSPFQEYVNDATPEQRGVLKGCLTGMGETMARILSSQEIPLPPPNRSALWNLHTSLMLADIALEELRPKYMRGYGALPETAQEDLSRIVDELQEWLQKMYPLAGQAESDFQGTVRPPDKLGDEPTRTDRATGKEPQGGDLNNVGRRR